MRYELMNLYYGHKLIAGSEASKDHFIANAKVDKKTNKPVWVVTKELPDTAPPSKEDELQARIKELEEALAGAEKGSTAVSAEPQQDVGSTPTSSTNEVGGNAAGSTNKKAPRKKA